MLGGRSSRCRSGAALLATVLTSKAVLSDPNSGLDSFYPMFLVPFYAIGLGAPVWVGGSIGGVWRFVANRRHLSPTVPRAHPAED